MESASFIIGIVIVFGLFFLLRWLIPSKGKVGEKVVAGKLDHLPKDQYRVLKNVTIPTPKGSSQIDHLVVSIMASSSSRPRTATAGFMVVSTPNTGRRTSTATNTNSTTRSCRMPATSERCDVS